MKSVAIVGLGWSGMPLALSLQARGHQVTGSKTQQDGVDAARMCGIDTYLLQLAPNLVCDPDDLNALLNTDVLVITLPARRSGDGEGFYFQAVQQLVDSALAHGIPHIIFLSSTSVYGEREGMTSEQHPIEPVTDSGKALRDIESWLHSLPGTTVDILRLAGLVGPGRHPGRFFSGKHGVDRPHAVVNLVHLDDVIAAITHLIETPPSGSGRIYNLCAPSHPERGVFYPAMARDLGLEPPVFVEDSQRVQGKWVDGSLICHELAFEYTYPDPMTMPLR